MPVNVWRGDSIPVAQISAVQVTADDAATTYAVTINGKSVSVAGTGTGVNDTAAALKAALAASTIPEFREVTWTVATDTVTGTASTAGVPFTATSSDTGGAGTIGAVTTTTANAGPNDWSTAANWSLGTVPVTGDDVYLQGSSVSITYGLDQNAVTLASLNQDSTFTGTVGLPRYNLSGGYLEYRPTYLKIGATVVNLGGGTGSGSGRIKLDCGTAQATWNVHATGSAVEQGVPAVLLKGTHASNVLNLQQGTVGVAAEAGDVSTLATIRIGYRNSQQTDADLTLGPGVTLAAVNQNGGVLAINSNVTTLNMRGGTATLAGTAAVTTLDLQEGFFNYRSSGTITNATVGTNATLDASQDPRAKTIGNLTLAAGATFKDPNKVVTFTNPLALENCSLKEVELDLGSDFNLQRS